MKWKLSTFEAKKQKNKKPRNQETNHFIFKWGGKPPAPLNIPTPTPARDHPLRGHE